MYENTNNMNFFPKPNNILNPSRRNSPIPKPFSDDDLLLKPDDDFFQILITL